MSAKPLPEHLGETYLSVVENSLAGMYIVQEGRFKYVNPSLIQMLGYERPDELLEVPFQQIIHPEDRPLTVTSGEASREQDGSLGTRCTFRALKKDASSVLVEMRESYADYLGKPANVGNLIDIADQKTTEEALHQSQERYTSILDHLEDGYYEVDIRGNLTFFNDSFCKIWGYPPEELMGMNNREYSDEENQKITYEVFNKLFRTGEPAKIFDWEIMRKDGSIRNIELSASLIRNVAGDRVGFRGIVRDATDRKRAEEELRKHRYHLEDLVNERTAELREVNDQLQREIEERKRAKETLTAEKNFSEDVINSLPGIFYLFDREGIMLRWNRNFEETAGYSSEEMGAMLALDFFGGEDRKAIEAAINQVFDEGRTLVEANLWTKSGTRIPTVFTGLRTVIDGVTYLVGVGIDITERKQAEEKLVGEKSFSEDVINSLPGIFYLFDRQGIMLRWNRNFEETTGYSSEEMGAMLALDFFEGDHKKAIAAAVDQVFDEGRTLVEANLVSKMGENIPTVFTGLRTVIDGITYLVGVGIDITERKKAMEALQASEEKLSGILRSVTDNMIMLDEDLSIVWANDVTRDFFGKDVVGSTCYEALRGNPEPCEPCIVKRCFREGTTLEWETQLTGVDEIRTDFWCTASVAARHEDGRPKRVLEVCRNISEKKVLEAEAMRASQLASLGELAAGVAHEINNPINGIINYAQMLVDQCEEEGQEADIPGRIIDEGERVAKIVRNLLSFARERTEGRGPARIQNILVDTLGLAERQIQKDGIRIRLDIPDDLPRIKGHSQQIQQVFLNLLSNARYALNQKYPEQDDDKVLDIRGALAEMDGMETVRMTFFDKGTGIPEDIIDKVCDPFFSTKPRGEGTGLGLSISYGIIKDHQGSLRVGSVEGHHTEVLIDLPLYQEGSSND